METKNDSSLQWLIELPLLNTVSGPQPEVVRPLGRSGVGAGGIPKRVALCVPQRERAFSARELMSPSTNPNIKQ
jgi:hypothetical protein